MTTKYNTENITIGNYYTTSWAWSSVGKDVTGFNRTTDWTSCKDYHTDNLREFYMKTRGVNGYLPEKPLTADKSRIFVAAPISWIKNLKANLNVLHQYEKKHRLVKTIIHDVTTKDNVQYVMIESSKMWMKNCFVYSLWLTILRSLSHKKDMTVDSWYDDVANTYNNGSRINESTYFKPELKKYIMFSYNNLRKFFDKEITYNSYVAGKENLATHSTVGIIFFANLIEGGLYTHESYLPYKMNSPVYKILKEGVK